MTSMTNHICAKCGKQLNPANWWTAGVYDRFGGEKHKLCNECAEQVSIVLTDALNEVADNIKSEYKRGYDDGLRANTKAAFAAAKQVALESERENAKLRKLVRDMWPWVWESGITGKEFHELRSRIRALGIEEF